MLMTDATQTKVYVYNHTCEVDPGSETTSVGFVVGCLIPLAQESKVWRDAIPIYISRGRFTADAVKSMLAKPEMVAKLFKSLE
jgi:hypothetical protein